MKKPITDCFFFSGRHGRGLAFKKFTSPTGNAPAAEFNVPVSESGALLRIW